MLNYFNAYGLHVENLRSESGTVSAINGIFKAPFDILGDKLRGYLGLTMDMMTKPQKVRKACEALMPHLYNVALNSSDPLKQMPIGYWMHRGCIPFVSAGEFESHYWPMLRLRCSWWMRRTVRRQEPFLITVTGWKVTRPPG